MSMTTVLIAEDEPLAAESLADWVRATPGLQLVAVCEDGEEALAQIRALKPALVLTDIQMPGLTGLQVAQPLQRGLVLAGRELGAVDEQSGRLVDGDEVFVEVQDGQRQDRSPST